MHLLTACCKPLHQPFPFFLESTRKNFLLCTLIAVLAFLFFYVFEPWNDKEIKDFVAYSTITWSVCVFIMVLLPRLLPKWFNMDSWTIGKFLGIVAFIMFFIGCFTFMYNITDCPPEEKFIDIFISSQSKTFTVGIIFTIILFSALQINRLREKISVLKNNPENGELISDIPNELFSIHAETKETLDINLNDFLYAQAQDNYSEIFWQTEDEVQSKLLRLTLKNLEDQINRPEILRCHRSYMVNIMKVKAFNGNSNGWKLQMESVENDIPVSRGYVKFIEPHVTRLAIHPN